MTGLDCNILVQLAFRDHPANARTVSAVQSEVKTAAKLFSLRSSSVNFSTSLLIRADSVHL